MSTFFFIIIQSRSFFFLKPSLAWYYSFSHRSFLRTSTALLSKKPLVFRDIYDPSNPFCNVPSTIASRMGMNLHKRPFHPINTIKVEIESYWLNSVGQFHLLDDLSPTVSTVNNFDSLLIEADHVSRSPSDTYYLTEEIVLRTHTSAHQSELLKTGMSRFLVTGDVFRRDNIDKMHYPIFHQMEGVHIFSRSEIIEAGAKKLCDKTKFVEQNLKKGLEGMIMKLFGHVDMRWVNGYFPFTEPSFELEIYFHNKWIEVLGCGVIHKTILQNADRENEVGWAFGLGLERFAMILFEIPDIRLFWTNDKRFHCQFNSGDIIKFQPYSKYPPCHKDISFWIPTSDITEFHANDLHEIVRDIARDLVESVDLIDSFIHPTTKRLSKCYRITYRSMDRNLTNDEIDLLQEKIRCCLKKLNVELR